MSLKFLIVDTYYPMFLRSFYRSRPGLKSCSYQEQLQAIMAKCFGTADFYSSNLKKLGYESKEVIANCEFLQKQWAWEKEVAFDDKNWIFQTLEAQIKEFRPDVLYVQDMGMMSDNFLWEIKPLVRLIVGQVACSLPQNKRFNNYDLILSSLPNIVEHFRAKGINSELLRLGFEETILKKLKINRRLNQVIHIGGYGSIHNERNVLLEKICNNIEIDFWGYGIENLSPCSPIRERYRGEAWGLDMYNLLYNSKVTVTRHISSVAGRFANNMRLYEATGVRTLLVTDYKDNLGELFIPGKEVVAYRDADEAVEQISYYLTHEEERKQIAAAGQQRTLKEHTYFHRMTEMVEIVKRYI
ncbi:glycosyltransferase [bacterium]|nr:glycosyltransferase [bacterium]